MYPQLIKQLKSNSFFLLGERGTGKTTLLENIFSEDEVLLIDLLKPEYLAPLQARPQELERILSASEKPW
jgi:predicted AAA+ superfamily ATPase